MGLVWPCSGWGLPCPRRRRRGGELLPRHFTLASREARAPGGRCVFCGTFPRSPGVAASDHPALRSPDFPPLPPHGKERRPSRPLRPLYIYRIVRVKDRKFHWAMNLAGFLMVLSWFTSEERKTRRAEGAALCPAGAACPLAGIPDAGQRAQSGEHRLDLGRRTPCELEGLPHRNVAQVEAGETSGGRAYGPQI